MEVRLRPGFLLAAAGQQGQGPASVWKYGCGLDFKQQPDYKAKAPRAYGSTATASTSSSSRTIRPRPGERLEVRLRPRLQAAAGQQGQGPAYVWKYGYGLGIKQQPDNKAKAQRAFGSTAAASISSSSSRTTSPRPSERLEVRLRPRLLAAAGQQVQGPASVWKYGYGLGLKQQPDNKAKAQQASGSTAAASTSSNLRPRLSQRLALFQTAAKQRQGPTSVLKWFHLGFFQQQSDGKANALRRSAATSSRSGWTARQRPSECLAVGRTVNVRQFARHACVYNIRCHCTHAHVFERAWRLKHAMWGIAQWFASPSWNFLALFAFLVLSAGLFLSLRALLVLTKGRDGFSLVG